MAAQTAPIAPAQEGEAARHLRVYLVHGTWGRGLRAGKTLLGRPRRRPVWSEPGGDFHEDLKTALSDHGLQVQIDSVNWSGSNSVLERDRIAQALARQLDTDAARDPGCRQLVIGHSHGGNIVLEAARRYRQAETDLHIVTLATPFIDLWTAMKVRDGKGYTQEFGRAYDRRAKLSKARGGVACFVGTCGLFWVATRFGLLPPFSTWLSAPPSPWYAMAFPLVLMVVTLLMTNTGATDDALLRVPRLDAPVVAGLARCRVLVLRGTDDEAGMALAGGAIQAVLGSRVSRIALGLLSVASLFIVALTRLSGGPLRVAVVSILSALGLFLLGSLLEAVGRAGAGREFLLTGGMLGISVNSAPDAGGDVTVRTLPGSPSTGAIRDATGAVRAWNILSPDYRFRHGLYAHRDCIPAIVAWLGQRGVA